MNYLSTEFPAHTLYLSASHPMPPLTLTITITQNPNLFGTNVAPFVIDFKKLSNKNEKRKKRDKN